ncbi:MAG: putative phage abortive infection protein [Bacteroides sp.]|nr:putative phage abortive infection protein [Bacteroides sp.]
MRKSIWIPLAIISVLISVVLILYFCTFNGGIIADYAAWAAFGYIFASIASLLAFVGVLINQNQLLNTEEKTNFNDLLKLYERQVDNLEVGNVKGLKAFQELGVQTKSLIGLTFLYFEIKNSNDNIALFEIFNSFGTTCSESIGCVYDNVRGTKGYDILKIEYDTSSLENQISSLNDRYNSLSDNEKNELEYLKSTLRLRIITTIKKMYDSVNKNASGLFTYSGKKLSEYISNEDYESCENVFSIIGDYYYNFYGAFLGQYYRNVYYLIDSLQNSKNKDKFSKIFRAQLSKDELVILLLNACSSRSTRKTIDMFKSADLFNNLDIDDLLFVFERGNKTILINSILEISYEKLN